MELRIDPEKTYAVALEGGGAKGAYQVGVWRALEEHGIRYNAVSGVSVGALNGAMMAMRDLSRAEELWENIRFSQVMDVPDDLMRRIFDRELSLWQLRPALRLAADVLKDGGFDVEPLKNLLQDAIDERRVRASDVNFYLVTYSISDRKELDLDAKQLPDGQLHDMLLASAYFPAFKNEPLGGKRYIDGGVQDAVPIGSLIGRGYRDIIVIRLHGFGIQKRVSIPKDANVITISPTSDLGGLLNFSPEQSRRDLRLGYYDGLRALYGLYGRGYYIDRRWTEEEAYARLLDLTGPVRSLRIANEEILPRIARETNADGDYYDVLLAFMEQAGKALCIDPFAIRTEQQLWDEILKKYKDMERRRLPKAVRRLQWMIHEKQEEKQT